MEEVWPVTLMLSEVSSSALRFSVVGAITVRREEDSAFCYIFLQRLQDQKNPQLHILSQFDLILVPF